MVKSDLRVAFKIKGALTGRALQLKGSAPNGTEELEGGYLWLGRPGKRARALTERELAWFEYSAQHYVKLKNDHLK